MMKNAEKPLDCPKKKESVKKFGPMISEKNSHSMKFMDCESEAGYSDCVSNLNSMSSGQFVKLP